MSKVLGPNSLSGRKVSDGIDFFETPGWATRKLLEVEDFYGSILEPCCGRGAICEVLVEQGLGPVIGYDLRTEGIWDGAYTGIDFRNYAKIHDFFPEARLHFDHVITNPPFYCAKEIIESSLAVTGGKVAMFLKLVFLESERRHYFFQETPLETVYVFSKRVNLYRDGHPLPQNSGTMAFAWFVFNHDRPKGESPRIKWLL